VTVALGAPGVIYVPQTAPRVLVGVRMDVAAFAGVAPRGPAFELADPHVWGFPDGTVRTRSVPVVVESWDEYAERFGSFEGPGLLPYAVAAFFQQGGQRAQIIRIVAGLDGVSDGSVPVPGRSRYDFGPSLSPAGGAAETVSLTARNEGSWGDRLVVTLSFATSPVTCLDAEPSALVLEPLAEVTPGAWLRLTLPDGSRVLRSVSAVLTRGMAGAAGFERVAQLDSPVPAPVFVERVDATLDVTDADPLRARSERFEGLGLLPAHPSWIGQVLQDGSNLVELTGSADGIVPGDVTLPPLPASLGAAGQDRYATVSPGDFFGTLLKGDDAATDGLDVLLRVPEVASVVAPDLYSPAPVPVTSTVADPPTFAGPVFAECVSAPGSPAVTPQPPGLDGLRLDPLDATDLAVIVTIQNQVVSCAQALGIVALLDVPPGLRQRAILAWRANFDSSYAAAYHPWLRAPLASAGSPLVTINPSGFAAGILARTESVYGVPHSPANKLAVGAVDVTDRVDPARHAVLHQNGIDVCLLRTDGISLMGARTLSRDPSWRQLNVRRVVSLVERTILSELAWTVFEPNDRLVRTRIELLVGGLLRQLFAQGAFAGATPAESYFVRTASDAALPLESDAGQLVCQIGLAVAEPLEFILVSISRNAQGALSAETFGG
jgi:uncharacterized protein